VLNSRSHSRAAVHCIEEYTNDLSYRESLQDLLDEFSSENTLPKEIEEEVAKIDSEFISVTEKSDLCVWDCGPKFSYFNENNIELLPISEYDKGKYWYYYRWQPDCPYSWKDNDAETYQKEMYGLDFARMSNDQLIEAVKKEVGRWNEQIEKMKRS
jgi:hypothetical protein